MDELWTTLCAVPSLALAVWIYYRLTRHTRAPGWIEAVTHGACSGVAGFFAFAILIVIFHVKASNVVGLTMFWLGMVSMVVFACSGLINTAVHDVQDRRQLLAEGIAPRPRFGWAGFLFLVVGALVLMSLTVLYISITHYGMQSMASSLGQSSEGTEGLIATLGLFSGLYAFYVGVIIVWWIARYALAIRTWHRLVEGIENRGSKQDTWIRPDPLD